VLEALAKVGALNVFGHPSQVLLGLDDAADRGQQLQRERESPQIGMFADAITPEAIERPLPDVPEAPVRERLRWEKELLGLYLSEHPMGEVADRVGEFVTAYSGDLKDETLDGQRLVIGGIVTGVRSIITKTKSAMAVATLEDLQGTIEVVVFPKLYEQTAPTWREGTILLVAGRVDHRGEEVSLLADLVVEWDGAVARGPEAFARDVAAGDRGSFRRRPPGVNGTGNGNGNGHPSVARDPVAVGPGRPVAVGEASPGTQPVQRVSPLRPDAIVDPPAASLPAIRPADPISTYAQPPDDSAFRADDHDEPALPDEARAAAMGAASAPTRPVDAGPGNTLHVHFREGPSDRLFDAMRTFRSLLRERPGDTPVVVHVEIGGTNGLPMSLRPVAYDAELVAEIRRRLGDGAVDLQLA
jgi:hypothetical protein